MNDTAKKTRLFMILNGLALFLIAVNLTAPVHESTHLLTQMAAGCKPVNLSYGSADTLGPAAVNMDSFFWKLMFEGSAALMNMVVGLILFAVLRKCRLKPLSRVFLLQLTVLHLCMGFGYLLRDGIAYTPGGGMGDWSKVLERFGGSVPLRIGMLAVGSFGYLLAFSIVFYEAYHFIGDNNDRAERRRVTASLYLVPYIVHAVVYTLLNLSSPIGVMNALIISGVINVFGYIAFFWGHMFVAHMIKPLKTSIYYFSPCGEKKPVLWVIALALVLIDAFILCPGIYF